MTPPDPVLLDGVAAELTRAGAAISVARGESLARHTTFGIGGPADLFVTVEDDDALTHTLQVVQSHALPLFVLGGGSNLLIADKGIRGVVLSLEGQLAELRVLDDGHTIDVGAGCSYPRLTKVALGLGWGSAVGWIGTPGQVGGALLMNAGSRQGEIGDVVRTVHIATSRGPASFTREECDFAYRTSAFQRFSQSRLNGLAIDKPTAVSSQIGENRWALTRTVLQCDNPQVEDAAELERVAKELLARRHQTQPRQRSAGSIFKNPPGDFAGRLIEAAGLKGFAVGGAKVSEVHANFVVNVGGASAADVLAVAEHARHVVLERFGVDLEWEVRRVGEFA